MTIAKIKTGLTFFSLFTSVALFAQGPGGRGGMQGQGNRQPRTEKPDAFKIMSKLDTNNDNTIDRDEASNDKRGKISEMFDKIDTDSNNSISLEELEASLENRGPKRKSAKELIKELDDNKDGTLNELEIAAKKNIRLMNYFKKIDINNDNELDKKELKLFLLKDRKEKRD
ncbi:EF-hand domain-containing protein [Aurantibacter sp.]|uniref:EF-hand domain-containing protein n=1 Tax=Aurantibacter sp. TaxID=2807103 RepID=UPI0035C79014